MGAEISTSGTISASQRTKDIDMAPVKIPDSGDEDEIDLNSIPLFEGFRDDTDVDDDSESIESGFWDNVGMEDIPRVESEPGNDTDLDLPLSEPNPAGHGPSLLPVESEPGDDPDMDPPLSESEFASLESLLAVEIRPCDNPDMDLPLSENEFASLESLLAVECEPGDDTDLNRLPLSESEFGELEGLLLPVESEHGDVESGNSPPKTSSKDCELIPSKTPCVSCIAHLCFWIPGDGKPVT